jgi:phage-related protein
MTETRKLLYWEGSSKKDFKEFPLPVQKDMSIATPQRDVELIEKRLKAVLARKASGRS